MRHPAPAIVGVTLAAILVHRSADNWFVAGHLRSTPRTNSANLEPR
jgi:hypothetical protein